MPPSIRLLIVPFLLALVLTPAGPPAQTLPLFRQDGLAHIPRQPLPSIAWQLGDVDGDGDLDLVQGLVDGKDRLLINDGRGRFTDRTEGRLPTGEWVTSSIALGDVDGDGDLDLVMGCGVCRQGSLDLARKEGARLLINDGQGCFTDRTSTGLPLPAAPIRHLLLVELDGDKDLDLVLISEEQRPVRVLLNDGTGNFNPTNQTWPINGGPPWIPAVLDGDGDGDMDLVVAGTWSSHYLLNDGKGIFKPAPSGSLPELATHLQIGVVAITPGDVDGDGDTDLVVGGQGQNQNLRLLVNNGKGTFADSTATHLPAFPEWVGALAWVDVDADGDTDLVVGTHNKSLGVPARPAALANRLLLNDGRGKLREAPASWLPAGRPWTSAIVWGDVDGDRDPDLVMEDTNLLLNDGTGVFTDTCAGPLPLGPTVGFIRPLLADVNGDGKDDALVLQGEFGPHQLWLNRGDGRFVRAPSQFLPLFPAYRPAGYTADLDGDGDLDITVTSGFQGDRLWLNDGNGRFTQAPTGHLPPFTRKTQDLAYGDVDGDGDLDMILAAGAQQLGGLYLNDGKGRFTDVTTARLPIKAGSPNRVAVGDVDGDGDPDIVFGIINHQKHLYLNDGKGYFINATPGNMPVEHANTFQLILHDLDGDGDLDLAGGRFAPTPGHSGGVHLYFNDGQGTFTFRTKVGPNTMGWFQIDRLDGDSHPDLVCYESQNPDLAKRGIHLYRNDGRGTFTQVHAWGVRNLDYFLNIDRGDLDGDGDVDLVAVGYHGFGNRVLVLHNLTRHLDAPYLPQPGLDYRIAIHSQEVDRRRFHLALLLLARATGRHALPPFGTLELNPAGMIGLPPAVIDPRFGHAHLTLPIPTAPVLLGSDFHLQALVVPDLNWPLPGARFTNRVSGRVIKIR